MAKLVLKMTSADFDDSQLREFAHQLSAEFDRLDIESVPISDQPGELGMDASSVSLPVMIAILKAWIDRKTESTDSDAKKGLNVALGFEDFFIEIDQAASLGEITGKAAKLRDRIEASEAKQRMQ